MKNAFLSFLESFASSRSAAALDRNRDAFFVKGRAKLTSDVSLRRPQTPNRRSARRLKLEYPRRSGSLSFVSTRSKVKFLLFFRMVAIFTNFRKKTQEQPPRVGSFRVRKLKKETETNRAFVCFRSKRLYRSTNQRPEQDFIKRRR